MANPIQKWFGKTTNAVGSALYNFADAGAHDANMKRLDTQYQRTSAKNARAKAQKGPLGY